MNPPALRHGTPLTKRETEVLALLAEGVPAKEAAERLGITYKTIDAHRQRIYLRLGATSLVDAVNRWRGHRVF